MFKVNLLFIVRLLLLGVVSPLVFATESSFGNYKPNLLYQETITESFYVPMRDGVKLAVSIARPAENGKAIDKPFPVIWHHTLSISREARDGTGGFISALHAMPTLAQHGYVVAQVARRGNGQSFGVMRGYHDRNEAHDAYEMTQWLGAQPWSDGNVGIYGCSNTGDAAMHAMTTRPAALKAVFAGCFSWNKFDAFRRGGIFAQWGTGPARSLEDDLKIPAVAGDENKILLRQAAQEHQLATPLIEMWRTLPYRDSWSPVVGSRFWAEGSSSSYMDQLQRSNIPLYVLGGWYDELRDQGLITFLNVPNTKVVMGPWQHCLNDDFPLLEEIQRFFDYHLKGIDTGIQADQKIHYFRMQPDGAGQWQATNSWPLPNTKNQQWFFNKTALASTSARNEKRTFAVNFEQNCPGETISARSQPCAQHQEGVSYTSAPAKAAVEVTGHPVADLWVSSSATDANVFVYLEDVAPDGTVTVVTEGRLKASMRKKDAAPWKLPADIPWHRFYQEDMQPLKPGEVVNLQFDLMPTSWVFQPGHKIQISVTGSDYRERLRDIKNDKQTISIYSDRQHASHINLPLISKN